MRFCVALSEPCALSENWIPFSERQEVNVPIDWLGARKFWIVAQFRDGNGEIIPALFESNPPQDLAQVFVTLSSALDTRTPLAAQPPPIQTMVAATQVAFPVSGSVEIAEGREIIGATIGQAIQIGVKFAATSPFAPVTEMRVKSGDLGGVIRKTLCLTDEEMRDLEWEPFVAEKSYPFTATVNNFFSFDVAVQFRDAQGHRSPIVCDDIAVEGNP